jgi:pyrroline-5-carboxylate reductase
MNLPETMRHTPMGEASVAFIGGGNMAGAVIGGLVASGMAPQRIVVVEPFAAARERLAAQHSVAAQSSADARLSAAATVVWAVKPQVFAEAAAAAAPWLARALHLSVMAGVRIAGIEAALGLPAGQGRIVRSMPNTPALIGRGIAGLVAAPAVTAAEREWVQTLLAPTGQTLWFEAEAALDAVTALSGSGPAYVFYVVEAMMRAAESMGLSAAEGKRLALATFDGAAALAAASPLHPAELRAQVTSKGGTTAAALAVLDERAVGAAFEAAVLAAQRRAEELGR